MAFLFISDVHLSTERPATARAFRTFLTETVRNSSGLYILGDLFDLWIGDDALDDFSQAVLGDLSTITQGGVPIWVMHGNHDFLYGEGFIHKTGCQLIPDPHVINLNGSSILLTHGDLLCTEDYSYQDFRRIVRNPEWQAQQLSKPIAVRQAIAKNLQHQSQIFSATKQQKFIDVTPSTVESFFITHQVQYLIHGHTHHPGIIQYEQGLRIVLPDWCAPDDGLGNEPPRGGYLQWNDLERRDCTVPDRFLLIAMGYI